MSLRSTERCSEQFRKSVWPSGSNRKSDADRTTSLRLTSRWLQDSLGAVSVRGQSRDLRPRGLPNLCDSALSRADACGPRACTVGAYAQQADIVDAGIFDNGFLRSFYGDMRAGSQELLLVPAMGITVLAAVSSWINPYEKMFHPMGEPKYLAANWPRLTQTTWSSQSLWAERAALTQSARWGITIS